MLDALAPDFRLAARALARRPGLAAAALLTLALGIGATTAVFSVVNAVLLRPLPYPESDRLVAIWPGHFASAGELDYLQRHARSFEGGAAAFSPGWGLALTLPREAVQLSGARASDNFFRVLAAGASTTSAAAEVRTLAPAMRRAFDYEAAYGREVSVVPLRDDLVGSLAPMLLVLLGAVAFIVLIAAGNVGNLLLARAVNREREMAVRAALGASCARIVRQLLAESVLLGAGGGAIGLALGVAGVRPLAQMLPSDLSRMQEVGVDAAVLVVCALLTLAVGIACGLAPALLSSRADLQRTMRGARGATGDGVAGRRLRGGLVVAEVALGLVLLIGAGLVLETLWRLARVDPGFRSADVLTMRVQPTGDAYGTRERRARYFLDVIDRLRGERGVLVVGAAQHLPLTGFDWHADVDVESRPRAPGEAPFRPGYRTVAGDYFPAMGIPLVEGRPLEPTDRSGAPPVALVSQAFARAMFPGQSAVGQRFRAGNATDSGWVTIVGVVGSVRHRALTEPPGPEFYLPLTQFPQGSMTLVVRTAGDPMRLARRLHEVVASVDRSVPISDLRTLDRLVSGTIATPRAIAMLLTIFATVGVALGIVGIYGVVSYSVPRRVREIGIRVALGAAERRVARMVVGEGMTFAAGGIAIGLVASALATRAMRALVYGVSPSEPRVYVALSLVLAAVAALASYLPARRAARVDPAVALRAE